MTGIADRLILYAQQFEDQHAPQTMTILLREAANEIERLRAEVETWVGKTKTAVWADSKECRLLTADNERLRAALEPFRALCVAIDEQAAKHKQPDDTIIHLGLTVGHFRQARAALEGKHE